MEDAFESCRNCKWAVLVDQPTGRSPLGPNDTYPQPIQGFLLDKQQLAANCRPATTSGGSLASYYTLLTSHRHGGEAVPLPGALAPRLLRLLPPTPRRSRRLPHTPHRFLLPPPLPLRAPIRPSHPREP